MSEFVILGGKSITAFLLLVLGKLKTKIVLLHTAARTVQRVMAVEKHMDIASYVLNSPG